MIGREYWAGVFLGHCGRDGVQHWEPLFHLFGLEPDRLFCKNSNRPYNVDWRLRMSMLLTCCMDLGVRIFLAILSREV